jgi:hypothetical protein
MLQNIYVLHSNFPYFSNHFPGKNAETDLNWFLLYFPGKINGFLQKKKKQGKKKAYFAENKKSWTEPSQDNTQAQNEAQYEDDEGLARVVPN